VIYGCGKFHEDAWTEMVTAEGERPLEHVLARHIEECPACKSEFAELSRMGLELRKALGGAPQAKEAFVASVMAEVAHRPRTGLGRKSGAGERKSFLGNLVSRPATLGLASALALLIVVASGVLPWGAGRVHLDQSTGYTAPGGTIMSLSERTDAVAAALTTRGVAVAAVASSEATALTLQSEPDSTARAIRAPLGIAAAVAQVNES